MKKRDRENEKDLEQEVEKTCESDKNCECEEHKCNCKHGENCGCENGEPCECEECECENCNCEHCEGEKETENETDEPATDQYLALAQRVQADFENYRRRMADQLVLERQEGVISVINVFLPCLDTFKEAKKTITDEKTLQGVEMIENKIMDALDRLKVERIEAVGQKFDPNLHDVIAVMHNENYDEDVILEEYQAGYKYNGKVIRYSKVIVNKREV